MILKTLKARSVRGIPRNWPDLAIGDRGLVIYGPNGMGKSSIVDALEYAVSSNSSLFSVNRQNVNWENGAPHIRSGEPDIEVEVFRGGNSFIIKSDIEPAASDDDQAWIDIARSASFVLRRHMLLQFISERPADRYELLQPFMNLDKYQELEDHLRNWKNQLEIDYVGTNATVSELQSPLLLIFELDGGEKLSYSLLQSKLNNDLKLLELGAFANDKDLEEKQVQIGAELGGEEQNTRLDDLGGLKSIAQRLSRASDLADLLKALITSLENLNREIEARTDVVLTDLLVRGKEAIEANELEICPVCEQDIARETVVSRLNERIEADQRISAERANVLERKEMLLDHLRRLSLPFSEFIELWGKHVETALPPDYAQMMSLFDEIEKSLKCENIHLTHIREFGPRLSATVANYDELIEILEKMIKKEGGGDRRDKISSLASKIEALLTDWPRYNAAVNKSKSVNKMKATITRIHDHTVEARKIALRVTLEEVAKTANAFYEMIHPNEGISTSNLEVTDVGQASVLLSTDFHGIRENPLLHYSESHLDTLGLCYFLAMRKHEAEKAPLFKILVLDDVMYSVDSDHRGRVATLIKNEFSDHQVIITTHDLFFFETLNRELGTGGFEYGRIINWDLDRGPVFGDPLTDFARITIPEEREKLSEEMLSSSGGRFFEWLLRETTESLEVAVQARFKRGYEIGQLWPPLAKRLRKQKGYANTNQAIIEELEKNNWVRNACGAHYNPAPAAPTLGEVREFGAMLASLHNSLFCRSCGTFISKHHDKSWRCPGSHKIYPK